MKSKIFSLLAAAALMSSGNEIQITGARKESSKNYLPRKVWKLKQKRMKMQKQSRKLNRA